MFWKTIRCSTPAAAGNRYIVAGDHVWMQQAAGWLAEEFRVGTMVISWDDDVDRLVVDGVHPRPLDARVVPGQHRAHHQVHLAGEVVEGMDVVDAIAAVPRANAGGMQNVPIEPVTIVSATVVQP